MNKTFDKFHLHVQLSARKGEKLENYPWQLWFASVYTKMWQSCLDKPLCFYLACQVTSKETYQLSKCKGGKLRILRLEAQRKDNWGPEGGLIDSWELIKILTSADNW